MLDFQQAYALPGIGTVLETLEIEIFWGLRQQQKFVPSVIDGSARDAGNTGHTTVLRPGLLMGKVASSGKLKEWNPTATDGTEIIEGVLIFDQKMTADGTDTDRWFAHAIVGGNLKASNLIPYASTTYGIKGNAYEYLIRAQLTQTGRFILDDQYKGSDFGGWSKLEAFTAAHTIDADQDNNCLFTNLGATSSVPFTLPAPKLGLRFGFFTAAGVPITISGASGTPIIGAGDASLGSVTLSSEIGTYAEIIGISSTQYILKTNGSGSTGMADDVPSRYTRNWMAGQRGKPGINADIQDAAEATRMVTDPDFEILGTNASSDDVTFDPEGGITLETDGADGDEVILLPHLDANQSAWSQITWGTDREVEWEVRIRTGANITNAIIWAGLKLTNTKVTATDADQVFFRYEDDNNDGEWEAINSIGGTDDEVDTGIVVAVNTEYFLQIKIDADRIARMYINGVLVETTTALTNAVDLIPFIGVAADGAAAAKSLKIRGQAISRAYA